ncbi:transposase [Vibrio lentus]|uniref:Aromatic amino acid permease n=2 Tax=Vibrio lentus TaxID=136468 RepID=A0AB36XL97_9VIBR|nr:transposase [Vibrio lentus]PMK32642.1 transposase [Vibrio lentus]PMK44974.1 transposase [Vibrio lentus]PML30015.1 transposase [Vibrio lentus]PMM43876.1 transposase [Vibrio lentus]
MDTAKPAMTTQPPSLIGGACIVACICVGAGMLGLPAAGAGVWTIGALIVLVFTMIIMTTSGCLLLEVLKDYPYRSSFSSITKDLLGKEINLFNNLMIYFVGGILLYAYITSSGLIINEYFGVSPQLASVLFVLVFSGLVWHSTKMVDRISIVLMLFMIISFSFGTVGLLFNVNLSTLFDADYLKFEYTQYVLVFFPIALTAFGYQHSVSTLRDYYREERLAQKAIIGGTLIALFTYTVWLMSVYGNLPRLSFGAIIAEGGNVDALLTSLKAVLPEETLSNVISSFSAAAILSSFIGVGIGVFDFLADLFQFDSTSKGRTKTWAVTFIPPLIFSLLFPFGFLAAIGYAASAAAIWACIIPAFLAKEARLKRLSDDLLEQDQTSYKVPGGDWVLVGVFCYGVSIIVINVLILFEMLPVFDGV